MSPNIVNIGSFRRWSLKFIQSFVRKLISVDIRLNPILEKRCSDDVKKHCLVELQTQPTDKEDDGRILHCLRKSFAKKVSDF